MKNKEEIREHTTTSSSADATDISKFGKLADPHTNVVEEPDGFADDAYSFSSSDAKELKHQTDPRYVDVVKQEKKILKWAKETGRLSVENKFISPVIQNDTRETLKTLYQDMSQRHGNCVIEVADNSFRVRKIKTELSSPVAVFQDAAIGKSNGNGGMILETADDDRVIGIPYTISNIGADKYYIINGRVYSGWAMWFGMQAIRSPEDYAKNVDLAYNIPFVWAGFQLKSQLSLGASFEISQGTDEEVTPEEDFLNEIFNKKLRININKLSKTSFHLDMYGNSYWHIRRDSMGIPDKITILQPERMKVFLDPKTTKVLYYIYLPPILAGMALTPYPNIRENPNLLHGPALTYPTPIVIDPQDIIHFKENDFTEYPYGLSSCKAMIDPATARMDINIIAPMIFKRYAKPLIHWRLDPMLPFQLTKGQIESYIDGFKTTLESLEPMSDPITSTRWSAQPIGAAQGKAELLTILQDLDNQIFACIGVSESYFKPQMGTDRMLAEQDKTLIAAMQQRQQMVGEHIQEALINPIIDLYDKNINEQLAAAGSPLLPQRAWNQYPKLQWRETFKQDQITTIQNTLALLQAGIIDHPRAARRVGEDPPSTSDELTRANEIIKINQEVQIEQAKGAFLQAQLQQVDTQQIMAMGGTLAVQAAMAEAQGGAEGGGGGGAKGGSRPSEGQSEPKKRVTFMNRQGKKQTEVMKDSTLNDTKKAGKQIVNVQPA